MGRHCADCGYFCNSFDYSSNQWRKGDGNSRCRDCVNGGNFECGQCGRVFGDQNQLLMHQQVHRPRDIACPVCGERRFKSGANAVQHLESGSCSKCSGGSEKARQQIYDFASRQAAMRPFLSNVPLLENGGNSSSSRGGGVPDHPYRCPECSRSFRNLSQLLQHQDQKHSNHRLLTY